MQKDRDLRPPLTFPSRVMVIDDDPFVREVLETALVSSGASAKIRTFGSGRDAIATAVDFNPELVLVDLHMPGMDGRETWKCLRETLDPEPFVIFLTADDGDLVGDAVNGFRLCGVIRKPFDPLSIVAQIQMMIKASESALQQRDVRLDGVKKKFQSSLYVTVEELEKLISDLVEDERGREAAQVLLEKAHALAGSAGMFHFDEIGTAADAVECSVNKYLEANCSDTTLLSALIEATDILIASCRRWI